MKEVVSPGDQGQLVDLVDALSPFFALATDPVSESKKFDNEYYASRYSLANSVLIKLVSPQAEQLSIHFILENQRCGTSLKDQFKDVPLSDRMRERKRREKSLASSGI